MYMYIHKQISITVKIIVLDRLIESYLFHHQRQQSPLRGMTFHEIYLITYVHSTDTSRFAYSLIQ
jgi:hypothetical protein